MLCETINANVHVIKDCLKCKRFKKLDIESIECEDAPDNQEEEEV